MTPEELFEIKRPRVERLVRFLVRQKGITRSCLKDIEQEAFLELWTRCCKCPNNPEKVGSLMSVKYAIRKVVRDLIRNLKIRDFTSYEDSEDEVFSGDFQKFARKTPILVVDGVKVTYIDLAIDLLENYNDKNLSREEIALKLNLTPEKIHQARKFLGLSSVDSKKCNDSLTQMFLQIEHPVKTNKKATRPRNKVIMICNDCKKKIETFPSIVKALNGRKYYCKKCIPKYKRNKPIRCNECGRIRSKDYCTYCNKKEENKHQEEWTNNL